LTTRLASGRARPPSDKNRRVRARRLEARAKVDPKRRASIRMLVVALGMLVVAGVMVARAYNLQVTQVAYYEDKKRDQLLRTEELTARRGAIKDREGADLAVTVESDTVFVEPRVVRQVEQALGRDVRRALAEALDLGTAEVDAVVASDRAKVVLRRRVVADAAKRVTELRKTLDRELAAKRKELARDAERLNALPNRAGFGTEAEPMRSYPNLTLAAHVLGFTDSAGRALAGVELAHDETLTPTTVRVRTRRDVRGRKILTDGFVPQAVLDGQDVHLTLDRQVQHVAERELAAAVEHVNGRAGVAIVMKADTGDLLALASFPTFNPNNPKSAVPRVVPGHQPVSPEMNQAIGAAYEPGSTLKMVTIAAGLEEQVIQPDSTLDCENGAWRVGSRTIHDTHRYGSLSVGEIMKVSSNICSAKIGLGLGKERLHGWLERFGFGAPTGVELVGERKGTLHPARSWREITLVNVAFGQGLAVTPLQIVQAAGVIANEGLLVRPRIVLGNADKAGVVEPREIEPAERVLSAQTARAVRGMMEEVTKKGGTAELAAIPGFSVAGKTGTAQKVDPATGAYSRELYVASFVGFVPAEKPEVVVLVLIDEPDKAVAYYGGKVAGPAWRAIASAALARLNVASPTLAAEREALAKAAAQGVLAQTAVGAAVPVEATDPALEAAFDPGELVPQSSLLPDEVDLADGAQDAPPAAAPRGVAEAIMPNLEGLSVAEVLKASAEIPCTWILTGTGRVVGQTPAVGARIAAEDRCELSLSPRG
jgi:cell division protein FtsI (penicillin-binding protein 3)